MVNISDSENVSAYTYYISKKKFIKIRENYNSLQIVLPCNKGRVQTCWQRCFAP